MQVRKSWLILFGFGVAVVVPATMQARTSDLCGSCHTMHNSQDGVPVFGSQGSAQPALLNNTCYGCHTGVNNGTTPYVLQLNGTPSYGETGTGGGANTLAGGNFHWVTMGDDATGHNVDGIVAGQLSRTPPGGNTVFDASSPLTCAGVNGCHGDRSVANTIYSIYQTHHSDPSLPIDGSSVAQSYRYLDGIVGIEDADWEYQSTGGTDHNQYKGVDRASDTDADADTISHLCAQCHGLFHSGSGPDGVSDGTFGVDPWIRHPVDYDMNGLGGEFSAYGGAGVNAYNIATPVASSNMSSGVKSIVLQSSGDAIVMCLSCHRAHGSPYPAMLRWNYQAWPGVGGYNGCGDCHTAKN